MKITLALLTVCLACCSAKSPDPPTIPACGFNIVFPGEAQPKEMKVKSHNGQDATVRVVVRDGVAFAVTWYDVPGAIGMPAEKIDALLGEAAESGAKGMRGKFTDKSPVMLHNRFIGLKVRIESPEDEMLARLYIADGRLFNIVVSGKHGRVNQEDAEEFFASFCLIDP
jgi:hypothetical protein